MDHGSESSETLLSSPLFGGFFQQVCFSGGLLLTSTENNCYFWSQLSLCAVSGRQKMLQPVQYGGKTVDFWLLTDSNQANMSNYIDKNVNKSFYPEEKSKRKRILPLCSLFICTIALLPPILSFLAVSSKHIKPIGDQLHPTGSMKITFTPLFVTHSIFIVWNIWCTQVETLILEDKFRMRRWIFYMQQIC